MAARRWAREALHILGALCLLVVGILAILIIHALPSRTGTERK